MSAAVVVDTLRKDYGALRAVDGISFEIRAGEVYGLLGQNGAGKTTTIEILEGHRSRSSGAVSVLGIDPADAGADFRDRIGIVLQSSGLEHELTVREAIELYGSAYRRRRSTDELLDMVELTAKAEDRIGTLSGGQRRRVDLALGIVGHPELVFLDEPTTGFDPAARRRSWSLIERLCSEGTTVLLTTHYLDEAEHLADRVGVLRDGRFVAEGTPEELTRATGTTTIRFPVPATVQLDDLLPADAVVADGQVTVTAGDPTRLLHDLTGRALDAGVALDGLTVTRPTLEDVYLDLSRVSEEPA